MPPVPPQGRAPAARPCSSLSPLPVRCLLLLASPCLLVSVFSSAPRLPMFPSLLVAASPSFSAPLSPSLCFSVASYLPPSFPSSFIYVHLWLPFPSKHYKTSDQTNAGGQTSSLTPEHLFYTIALDSNRQSRIDDLRSYIASCALPPAVGAAANLATTIVSSMASTRGSCRSPTRSAWNASA